MTKIKFNEYKKTKIKGISVFDINGNNYLWPKFGANKNKLFLATIPKSGTWLAVEILKNLDFEFCGVEAREARLIDHRFLTPKEQKEKKYKVNDKITIENYVNLVGPGQFVVGHLPCTERARKALNGWKIILLHRDMRNNFISALRWTDAYDKNLDISMQLLKLMEKKGTKKIQRRAAIAAWKNYNAFCMPFELLTGTKNEQKQLMENLTSFLNCTKSVDTENIFNKCLGSETMTYSGKNSNYQQFWTDELEEIFIKNGAIKINEMLGYNH